MIKFFPELRRRRSDGLASALGLQDYRDPFEIQFGLFGDDDSGGGSDNVDRSNPNEMAAREKAAARAGTVTDGKGNAVTSVNPDGSRSVVTTGTQAQQVAAREAFNATDPRASDTRSNYAQDQYDQVAARETAALNRAAEAGRLASAPASSALANVGDVTQAQYGPFASDQPQVNFVAPQISRPEVNLSATSRPDIPANAQNMSNQILSRRVGSPAAFGIDSNIAMTALQDRALQGDVEAQDMLNQAATRGDITRDQADYAFGFTQQAPAASAVGQTLAENATAANVLGSLPTPGGTVRDLQAQRQLQGPPQFIEETRNAARTISPTGQALEEVTGLLDYPGTVFDRPTSSLVEAGTTMGPQQAADAAAFAAQQAPARQLSPLEQSVQAAVDASTRTPEQQAGVTPTELMGQQAAAGTPAENFYTDAYRGVYPDVEGNIPGTTMAGIGNAVQEFSPLGMIARGITGADPLDLPSASEQAAFNSGQLLSMGGTMDEQTGAISDVPAGRGTLNMNRFGMVTYSGMPDPSYDGPYANLVNPPADTGGDGGEQYDARTVDPCPEGYQMVDGVCTPVDDVTADEPAAPGSNFVINPTTGLPTLFQPTTQATQVGQINPFVLQPYTPMQAQNIQQARSGIQALSPTGAALGRQV